MRRKRGALFAVAASLLLALAGCSTSVGGAAAPAVTLSPVIPLKLEAQPAWGAEQVGVPGLQAVQFGTDTAVVMGSATWPSTDAAIAGVDLDTGTVRWSYADYAELAGGDGAGYVGGTAVWGNLARIVSVGGDPADQIVVVTYLTTTCTDASGFCAPSGADVTDEYGIAALNPADGSVRWKAPIVPAVPGDSPEADKTRGQRAVLVDADSDGVLVLVGGGTDIDSPSTTAAEAVRTVLLDPASGAVRWEAPGTRGTRLIGDQVLAAVANGGPTIKDLGALDVRTGALRWAVAASFPSDVVSAAAGDTGILLVTHDTAPALQPIDLSDGSSVGDAVPVTFTGTCLDDATTLIACGPADDERILVWTGTPGPPTTSAFGLPDASQLQLVTADYVFAGDGESSQAFTVDGRAASDPLPGRTVAMDDRYLAIETTPGGGWAVYRLR